MSGPIVRLIRTYVRYIREIFVVYIFIMTRFV
nr:MAG TPA: hypothetical protein [Caudoviricetes sp.]